jgi:hypothetical protein
MQRGSPNSREQGSGIRDQGSGISSRRHKGVEKTKSDDLVIS